MKVTEFLFVAVCAGFGGFLASFATVVIGGFWPLLISTAVVAGSAVIAAFVFNIEAWNVQVVKEPIEVQR